MEESSLLACRLEMWFLTGTCCGNYLRNIHVRCLVDFDTKIARNTFNKELETTASAWNEFVGDKVPSSRTQTTFP